MKEADLPADILNLNLVVEMESSSLWMDNRYGLSHLIIQEFLAALYAVSEFSQGSSNIAQLPADIDACSSLASTLWSW